MSKIMRVSEETYFKLGRIKKDTGFSIQEIIDKAVERFEREMLLTRASQAYAAIKNDSEQWKEDQHESDLWDYTLKDGLEDE